MSVLAIFVELSLIGNSRAIFARPAGRSTLRIPVFLFLLEEHT